ncbi:MAG TPA: hypothetical protein VMH77_02220 [Steroidobacteraceae bacterium]|nr:hypothetical protein [Steroidobacteraceae bacterium]
MGTSAETINGAARAAGASADDALRRKASQLQKFFDDVEDLLEKAGIDESDVERVRNRVGASIQRAATGARDGVRAAVDGTRRAALATDQYVRAKPWMVIGMTAVAGVLLGALLRGSRKE